MFTAPANQTSNRNSTQVGSGSGLAFVAISEAVSEMSAPYIWSILFFTMLILLGLDSEFGTLEGAVTPLVVDMNLFPKIRKEIVSGEDRLSSSVLWGRSHMTSSPRGGEGVSK